MKNIFYNPRFDGCFTNYQFSLLVIKKLNVKKIYAQKLGKNLVILVKNGTTCPRNYRFLKHVLDILSIIVGNDTIGNST